MNIFEDLIDELKEEHLLETTIIEQNKAENVEDIFAAEDIIVAQTALENNEATKVVVDDIQTPTNENLLLNNNTAAEFSPFSAAGEKNAFPPPTSVNSNNLSDKAEFYRGRATLEVSSLQMVEHVLSGIEREQMKILPKSYNDLEVKKALHSFLQVSYDANPAEHAQSEFQLMQETESWYSSLSHRDRHISVANLRRYCENTRPALSSQALTSLARFYRNSPYSESVRNKFDLIITRLFSKEIGSDKRRVFFKREEMIEKLIGLYEEWSSISLYSTDEENSDILLTAFKFEDFMAEAANAESFDELIQNDFFNRLRIFKESTNEQFFAPLITAAAIESNIRIGNRYVELLEFERAKGEAEKLENKYGFLHDQVISDATSKTLQLVELLKEKKELTELVKEKAVEKTETLRQKPVEKIKENSGAAKQTRKADKFSTQSENESQVLFTINKSVLLSAIFIIIACLGFYFLTGSSSEDVSSNVNRMNLENSSLKEYIKENQINNQTFFGVVKTSWEDLSPEKKEEILKKILSVGGDKGFDNVSLQNEAGITVGTAQADKVKIF